MSETDDYFRGDGPHDIGFQTKWPGSGLPFTYGADLHGATLGARCSDGVEEPIQDNPYSQTVGVMGRSNDRRGVTGASFSFPGVYGETGESARLPQFPAGVYGAAEAQPGVIGYSTSGDGVQGASYIGTALAAYSFYGPAMLALSRGGSGVMGICYEPGPVGPDLPGFAGVIGTCSEQAGVIGTSNASVGLYGFSSNYVGVYGQTGNPASYAGHFIGNVQITGTLMADAGAMVPFPDGSRRLLHCMGSPEHWFEDFGAGRLKRGRAVVKLDADFAKVIKRGDYHVFLTPKGDCGGLYVRRRGGGSFEVRELGGGKSNVAFSYRIVGRRKDIKAHRRFAATPALPSRPVAKSPKPTAAALRGFMAEIEKRAREAPQGATSGGRADALPGKARRS